MIRQIQLLLAIGAGLCAAYQLIAFQTIANATCILIVLATSLIVGFVTFRKDIFQTTPFSALQVVAFTLSNLAVPLFGTTLEGKAITQNLNEPYAAFGYSALAALTLMIAQWIYRNARFAAKSREYVAARLWTRLGYFTTPTSIQMWGIGGVGCMALVLSAFLFNKDTLNTGGVVQQTVHGFVPFSYAPFLIPVAHYFWDVKKPTALTWVLFAGYFGLVLLLSMALNTRSAILFPLATAVGCVVLAMLIGRLKTNLFRWRTVFSLLVLFFVVVPILRDMATAMRVARLQRSTLSSEEMIEKSIEAFFDKKQLRQYERRNFTGGIRAGEWDERYITNEFFQRFTTLKYTDNGLHYIAAFGPVDRQGLADFSHKRFVGMFPSPLLKMFGIYFNKFSAQVMSYGDYIYYARTGFNYAGFRTGSFIATEMALHGYWMFLHLALLAFVVFWLTDSFCRTEFPGKGHSLWGGKQLLLFSPIPLIFLYEYALFFNGEAMTTFLVHLMRATPQTLVLYFLLFWGTRPLNMLLPAPAPIRGRMNALPPVLTEP